MQGNRIAGKLHITYGEYIPCIMRIFNQMDTGYGGAYNTRPFDIEIRDEFPFFVFRLRHNRIMHRIYVTHISEMCTHIYISIMHSLFSW